MLHILEIFARAGYGKDLADQFCCIEAHRDGADYIAQVKVLCHLALLQHMADVATVTVIPAQTVHIGGISFHFLYRGSVKISFILHQSLLLKTVISYSLTVANHSPSAGTPQTRQYSVQISPKGMVFISS